MIAAKLTSALCAPCVCICAATQATALSTSASLALEPLPLPPPGWPKPGEVYAQRDLKASRKVVQPLLVAIFDQAGMAKPQA
jgi:hypothetical protein